MKEPYRNKPIFFNTGRRFIKIIKEKPPRQNRPQKAFLKEWKKGTLLSPAKRPFLSTKKIVLIFILTIIIAATVYAYYQTQSTLNNLDKRPFAKEFATTKTLPQHSNVTKDSAGKIVLNPVNNRELIFAENKLEQTLEKDMDSVGFTKQVSQIKSITRYKMVDGGFDSQSEIVEVIVSDPENQIFAIQYLDEYKKGEREASIDSTNETKTLTSLTKILKKLPVYDVVQLDETKKSSEYSFMQRNGNEVKRYVQYSDDFSSANVYEQTSEGSSFEEVESLNWEKTLMSAYHKSIEEISKITESDYDEIMSNYKQKKYDKDYIFKE